MLVHPRVLWASKPGEGKNQHRSISNAKVLKSELVVNLGCVGPRFRKRYFFSQMAFRCSQPQIPNARHSVGDVPRSRRIAAQTQACNINPRQRDHSCDVNCSFVGIPLHIEHVCAREDIAGPVEPFGPRDFARYFGIDLETRLPPTVSRQYSNP